MVAVGKIVEVQGGHVLRGTGRKDRHSKVYTSKGPRDRRVRLSAGTAIQFYDVQDRLGYDRPSEAVDWLIMKAKASIDALNEQPAGMPSGASIGTSASSQQGRKCHENHAPESSSLKEFVGYGLQHGSSGYEAVLQDFHHVTEDSAYISSYLAADEFNLLSDELSNEQLGNETEDMRICTEALQASVLRQDQWSGWSDQLLKGKGQFPDTMSLNSKLNTRNEDDNSDFSSWPLSLQLSVLGQYHSYSRETALQFGSSSLIDSVISPEISDSDLCQRALLGTGFSYSNVATKHYDSMQIPGFEANHNSVFQSSNPAP